MHILPKFFVGKYAYAQFCNTKQYIERIKESLAKNINSLILTTPRQIHPTVQITHPVQRAKGRPQFFTILDGVTV